MMDLDKARRILAAGGGMFGPQAEAAQVVLAVLDEIESDRKRLAEQARLVLDTLDEVQADRLTLAAEAGALRDDLEESEHDRRTLAAGSGTSTGELDEARAAVARVRALCDGGQADEFLGAEIMDAIEGRA